jgi:hypothetical protein
VTEKPQAEEKEEMAKEQGPQEKKASASTESKEKSDTP